MELRTKTLATRTRVQTEHTTDKSRPRHINVQVSPVSLANLANLANLASRRQAARTTSRANRRKTHITHHLRACTKLQHLITNLLNRQDNNMEINIHHKDNTTRLLHSNMVATAAINHNHMVSHLRAMVVHHLDNMASRVANKADTTKGHLVATIKVLQVVSIHNKEEDMDSSHPSSRTIKAVEERLVSQGRGMVLDRTTSQVGRISLASDGKHLDIDVAFGRLECCFFLFSCLNIKTMCYVSFSLPIVVSFPHNVYNSSDQML